MELFGQVLLILIGSAAAIFIYMLPGFVAYRKKKKNTDAIVLLNFLTGWSGIGWLIALIWAATND